MNAVFTVKFRRQLHKLPTALQKKFDKQFQFVMTDYRHPSLRARKMGGEGLFEARLDRHNRFTYIVYDDAIHFIAIGPHDTGLGKK